MPALAERLVVGGGGHRGEGGGVAAIAAIQRLAGGIVAAAIESRIGIDAMQVERDLAALEEAERAGIVDRDHGVVGRAGHAGVSATERAHVVLAQLESAGATRVPQAPSRATLAATRGEMRVMPYSPNAATAAPRPDDCAVAHGRHATPTAMPGRNRHPPRGPRGLPVTVGAMYLEYYGLREPPFSITPDPRFVFL